MEVPAALTRHLTLHVLQACAGILFFQDGNIWPEWTFSNIRSRFSCLTCCVLKFTMLTGLAVQVESNFSLAARQSVV